MLGTTVELPQAAPSKFGTLRRHRVRSPKEVLCVVGDADGVGLLVRVRVAKVESCFTLGSL